MVKCKRYIKNKEESDIRGGKNFEWYDNQHFGCICNLSDPDDRNWCNVYENG